jgi:plasmid stabilization system protein ParE
MSEAYRISISPEAAADLYAIHDYIAQDSFDNAARMVGRILDAIDRLKSLPHRAIARRQSRKVPHPVRSLPVRPYMVFFRVLGEERVIRVLTIRHGARRRPKTFE